MIVDVVKVEVAHMYRHESREEALTIVSHRTIQQRFRVASGMAKLHSLRNRDMGP